MGNKIKYIWSLVTRGLPREFQVLVFFYFLVIVLVLIVLQFGVRETELNLPLKELGDLNLAIEKLEKNIIVLENQVKVKNEGEQSHKLAYFILGGIAIFFLIKGMKPECLFGSSPDVSLKLPTPDNMSSHIVSKQPAEAAVNVLQITQKPETSMVCFQPATESSVSGVQATASIDPNALAVLPQKLIFNVLDYYYGINWWILQVAGRHPISGKFQNYTDPARRNYLGWRPPTYQGGLRGRPSLSNEVEGALSNRDTFQYSQDSQVSTQLIEGGVKVLGEEPISLTSPGYFLDGVPVDWMATIRQEVQSYIVANPQMGGQAWNEAVLGACSRLERLSLKIQNNPDFLQNTNIQFSLDLLCTSVNNLADQMALLLLADCPLEHYDTQAVIFDLVLHLDSVLSPLY